ncbi:EAL domain-containing protein [Sulfurimonas sp. C5]|uniref:sensor domain-containing protein n=1 Tax=Sulfurimonas sp. C5 TaxID=3036947 RepID=UPI0024587076|nr:EAL domain-containing protein [Sulfurimonas sp. C5]MDH4943844.1 EAL domain-containing protein [Sulfurimonas sp. C5]
MMDEKEVFYTQLVDIAYKQLKSSSLFTFMNAIVLAFILYPYVNSIQLGIWIEFVFTISLYRYLMAKSYQTNPMRYSRQKWRKKFFNTLIISNIIWSIPPVLFFPNQNYMVQAAIIILYTALSAGAMSSFSSFPRAIRIYLIMFLGPLIIVLFLQNTQLYTAMGILLSLYTGLLIGIGNKFYTNYQEFFKMNQLYEEEKEKFSVSEERFEVIFKGAPVGFFFYDEHLIIREVNQKLIDFFKIPRDKLIGLDLHNILDRRILPALQTVLENRNGLYDGKFILNSLKKDIYINLQTSPMRNAEGKVMGGIGIVNNVTEKMEAQQKIERQAKYDILTDIPNRLMLHEQIKHEVLRYQRHNIIFAVLFLDLDHFKHINDSLGHDIGDKLLIKVAQVLERIIRTQDIVARLGGDEFVILLPDLSLDRKMAARKAELVAKKIYDALEATIMIDGHQFNISTSIGISLVNSVDETAEDILKHADLAMYQAKKDGRGVSRFYEKQMDSWIKRRLDLENGLKNSLHNGELQVYYQPIVEVISGKVIGAEALLRWNSKEFADVSPEEYISIAEESMLIIQIGNFVMQKAFEEFVVWKKQFANETTLEKIAINVSIRQFNCADFIENLKEAMKKSNIKPEDVEVELVESLVINDFEQAKEKMYELRNLGIRLSIDDFGTGYSSLSYLKQLPFSTLKIDREFIKDIEEDPEDKELVETILNIAKRFDLKVVAEGVETHGQYMFLLEQRCDFFQGFYCSKALDADSFVKLLREQHTYCPLGI